ncbi:MAG: SPOR domain-containing protein [Sideroxyarcus sp.]|nr:SPOR domain-containing protein [Sideroxyarcus sp.]
MSNGGNGQKSKVVAGLIIGMVLGVAVAGFVAWYVVNKNPASFSNKEQREPAKSLPQVQQVPMNAPSAASGVGAAQHYEFYKVLPDKAEGGTAHKQATAKPQAAIPTAKPPVEAADSALYFVQAGSFQNADDAEKLKAKLALAGMEASVQKADVPGKGVWYRVRLGTYKGLAEANSAIANLKQNGISNATALHVQ